MPDPIYHNIIRFKPDGDLEALSLTVESDWVWEAGVKPSIFAARVPYTEFDKLGGNFDRVGQLEFYFANDPKGGVPDLTLKAWRLVDIVPLGYAPVTGADGQQGFRHYEFRMGFADARDQFTYPRGGYLREGEINKEPFSKDRKKDAQNFPVRTADDLVRVCLKAMGLKIPIPQELTSDAQPPLNLDWRGNPAPEELDKLLSESGFTFVVKPDGTFAIEAIGKGNVATPPAGREIINAAYPGVDRRGKAVIFSSAPLGVVERRTFTLDDGLEWVILDDDGRFKTIENSNLLKDLDPLDVIAHNFEKIPAQWRIRVMNYLYRAVRVIAEQYGPQQMLRYNYELETGLAVPIGVKAKVATHVEGTWYVVKGNDDWIEVPVLDLHGDCRVIVFEQVMAKLKPGKRYGSALLDLAKLENDDLKIDCSREVYDEEPNGKWTPRFFQCGYKQELRGIAKLTDDEIDTVFATQSAYVPRPELRLFIVDGQEKNREKLEDQASTLAKKYIGTTANSRIYAAAGYVKAELSGQVNQIKFSPNPPATTWQANTSFFPHVVRFKKPPVVKGKFPKALETEERRGAEGLGSFQQPAVRVSPSNRTAGGAMGVVRITEKDSAGGEYKGKLQYGSATIKPTDLFEPNHSAAIKGMSDGADVQVLNLWEGGNTHSLGLPLYALCERIGTADDDKTPIVVVRVAAVGTNVYVNLTKTGGTDGDGHSPPTYVYTVKLINGEKVGPDGAGPELGRSNGSFKPALHGYGYFTPEGNFVLAYAHEVENTFVCGDPE